MTLRRKLLLVALSTLALPWAGWLYVRQMEHLLRNSQEQALLAIAFALDRGLVAVGADLPRAERSWYVQQATRSIVVDGSERDWASMSTWAQRPWRGVEVQLAHDPAWLYLRVNVEDATAVRLNARDPAAI
jgi:hypothetical protein